MAAKLSGLETLRTDVAIISEAHNPGAETAQNIWYPSASRLGIRVRALGPYKVKRLPQADLPNCVVPVSVAGPSRLTLLAIWTWPAPSCTKAFLNGLTAYAKLLRSGPTVVACDFNGSPAFGKPNARSKWWTQGFSQPHDSGLVSAYHQFHAVAYGAEAHATHHFLRRPERPFHIDFCFVPRVWAEEALHVHLEDGPEWRTLSDHFPLVVETRAVMRATARERSQ
jgi:hypothetical protein